MKAPSSSTLFAKLNRVEFLLFFFFPFLSRGKGETKGERIKRKGICKSGNKKEIERGKEKARAKKRAREGARDKERTRPRPRSRL